jgi:hypothetical protein
MINLAWSQFVIRIFTQIVFVFIVIVMIQMEFPNIDTMMNMPDYPNLTDWITTATKS